MADTITVSGTDPTNPRSVGDILIRLEQIERDTRAMHAEAGRLAMFIGCARQVMAEQGVTDARAGETVARLRAMIMALRSSLGDTSASAKRAGAAIRDTKVSKWARFTWRPTRGGN